MSKSGFKMLTGVEIKFRMLIHSKSGFEMSTGVRVSFYDVSTF